MNMKKTGGGLRLLVCLLTFAFGAGGLFGLAGVFGGGLSGSDVYGARGEVSAIDIGGDADGGGVAETSGTTSRSTGDTKTASYTFGITDETVSRSYYDAPGLENTLGYSQGQDIAQRGVVKSNAPGDDLATDSKTAEVAAGKSKEQADAQGSNGSFSAGSPKTATVTSYARINYSMKFSEELKRAILNGRVNSLTFTVEFRTYWRTEWASSTSGSSPATITSSGGFFNAVDSTLAGYADTATTNRLSSFGVVINDSPANGTPQESGQTYIFTESYTANGATLTNLANTGGIGIKIFLQLVVTAHGKGGAAFFGSGTQAYAWATTAAVIEATKLQGSYNTPAINVSAGANGTVGNTYVPAKAVATAAELSGIGGGAEVTACGDIGYILDAWTSETSGLVNDAYKWAAKPSLALYKFSGAGPVSITATFKATPTPSLGGAQWTYDGLAQGPTAYADASAFNAANHINSHTGRYRGSGNDGVALALGAARPTAAGSYEYVVALRQDVGNTPNNTNDDVTVGYAVVPFTVQRAVVSVSSVNIAAGSKVYDGTTDATGLYGSVFTATFSGYYGGGVQVQPQASLFYVTEARFADKNVVTANNYITASFAFYTGEYNHTFTGGVNTGTSTAGGRITPGRISGLEDLTVTYGYEFLAGVSVIAGTGFFGDKPNGTVSQGAGVAQIPQRPTVAVSGTVYTNLTFTSLDSNYTTTTALTVKINVLRKELTAVFTPNPKDYNALTDDLTATVTLSGAVFGQTIYRNEDFTVLNLAFASPDAGTVGASGAVALIGNAKTDNYVLASGSLSGTAEIRKIPLSASLSSGISKVYDGTDAANVTLNISGLIAGQTFVPGREYEVTAVYDGFNQSSTLTKNMPVTVTVAYRDDTDVSKNYIMPVNTEIKTVGAMSKQTLKLTVSQPVVKTYDGTDMIIGLSGYTFQVEGFYDFGSSVQVQPAAGVYTVSGMRFSQSDAGEGIDIVASVVLSGEYKNFYQLNASGAVSATVAAKGMGTIEPFVISSTEQVIEAVYGERFAGEASGYGIEGYFGKELVSGTLDWSADGEYLNKISTGYYSVGEYEGTIKVTFIPDDKNYAVCEDFSITVSVKPREVAIDVGSATLTFDKEDHTDVLQRSVVSGVNDGVDWDSLIVIKRIINETTGDPVAAGDVIYAYTYIVEYTVDDLTATANYKVVNGVGFVTIEKAALTFEVERTDGVITVLNTGGYEAEYRVLEGNNTSDWQTDLSLKVNNYRDYTVEIRLTGDDAINYYVTGSPESAAYESFALAVALNVAEAAGAVAVAYGIALVIAAIVKEKRTQAAFVAAKKASDLRRAEKFEAERKRILRLKEENVTIVNKPKPNPELVSVKAHKKPQYESFNKVINRK